MTCVMTSLPRFVVGAAVAVALVLVPEARASSFGVSASLPGPTLAGTSEERSAGPVLVPGAVLWAEPRGSQATVMAAASTTSARALLSLPPVRTEGRLSTSLDVVGFAGGAVLQRTVWGCRPRGEACAGSERMIANDVVRVDPATGTAGPLDVCFGAPTCSGCRASAFDSGLGLQAHDSVLVVNDGCGSGVSDFADGATRRIAGRVVAAAGAYAIVDTSPDEARRLALINWRTGERIRLLPSEATSVQPGLVGVDTDGSIAYFTNAGAVAVQAITGIRVTTLELPEAFEPFDDLRIAAGAVAVRRITRDFQTQDVSRFTVWRAGRIHRVSGQRVGGGWDFDGKRLTWATQPCALTTVQVWDLDTPPPTPAREACTLAASAPTARLGTPGRALRVTLTCPPTPEHGCAGSIRADLITRRGGRRVGETYLTEYRIRAGSSTTATLQLLRPVRSRRALAGRIELSSMHGGPTARKRVVIRRG